LTVITQALDSSSFLENPVNGTDASALGREIPGTAGKALPPSSTPSWESGKAGKHGQKRPETFDIMSFMVDKETGLTQSEILAASKRLIFEEGSAHLSVARLARELGKAEGALSERFGSDNEIMQFLIEETGQELAGTVERISPLGLNQIQLLEKIMFEHLADVLQKKFVLLQILARAVSSGDRAILRAQQKVLEDHARKIEGIIDEGIQSGIIRPDTDSSAAAKLFLGMIQYLVDMAILRQDDKDLQKEFSAAWNVFQKALINTSYEQTA
jgi:AcrR family transcriptional regulator